MSQRREAAIVGIHEYPLRVAPGVSSLQIKAASAAKALSDAGLNWQDVDAVYDTGTHQNIGGLGISEYLGLKPDLIDTTSVGGSSYEFQANHAATMIATGKANVALLTYGSTAHSDRRAIGTGGATGQGSPTPFNNMEDPWGMTLISNYGMVKARHMHQYGTSREQLAEIAVAARAWAAKNPKAMMRDALSIDEVLAARMVSDPLTVADCCLITDGAGALIMTRADRAKDFPNKPAYVLGVAADASHDQIAQMEDLTVTAAARSGPRAYEMAAMGPSDMDVLELYDAFTINTLLFLEDLGFCKKGEGGAFVEGGHIAPGGGLAVNTNGGGLSCVHPGMYGIFLLCEAVEQLRGSAGARQVAGAETALVHGNGGTLSTQVTAIFGTESVL